MAKYNGTDAVIEFDNSGGSLVDMTDHITSAVEIEIERSTDEITPINSADEVHADAGINGKKDIEIEGPYDDTAATGPDAIFNALGATRTLKVTYGSTKTSSVETIIINYKRKIEGKKITGYSATVKPTGAVTET